MVMESKGSVFCWNARDKGNAVQKEENGFRKKERKKEKEEKEEVRNEKGISERVWSEAI